MCVCVYERKGLHQFVSHTFSYHLNHGGTTEPCDDLKLYLLNRMAVLFSSCYSVQRERDSFGIGHFCTGCVIHTPDPPTQWISWRDTYCTGTRPLLMAVNPVTCVSGVLTVSKGCSLSCDAAASLTWSHFWAREVCSGIMPVCLKLRSNWSVSFPYLPVWWYYWGKHIKDSRAGPTTALGQYLLSPEHSIWDISPWQRASVLKKLGFFPARWECGRAVSIPQVMGPHLQFRDTEREVEFLPSLLRIEVVTACLLTGDFQDSQSLEMCILKIISRYIYLQVSRGPSCFLFIM